jgi:carbamoyl-phosphate synthase large subunit
MENVNILITGAGAPGIKGTIYSLKKEFNGKFIGTDLREDCVGRYLLDKVYKVPKPSEEFIGKIFEICEQEEIQVILPQVTKELPWLSKYKEEFEKKGIKVLVSDYDSLIKVNNKYLLLKTCFENNIDCVGKFFLAKSIEELEEYAKEIGYPNESFVVKVLESSGMRGLRIITSNFDSYNDFLFSKPGNPSTSFESFKEIFKEKEFPELLVTEYFPGEEFSVDILANKGEMVVCVPRSRDIIRTGITFEGVTKNNPEIIEYCRKLVQILNLDYMVGFQFKRDKNNRFKILESNPRVQGTMVHSTFANVNIIAGAVKQALNKESNLNQKDIIWETKLKRMWGGVGDNGQQINKI